MYLIIGSDFNCGILSILNEELHQVNLSIHIVNLVHTRITVTCSVATEAVIDNRDELEADCCEYYPRGIGDHLKSNDTHTECYQ